MRINESRDDDDMYEKTNAIAHRLDPTRPTGGVRCIKNSHLLEDVYTYNDFIHNGANAGCQPKKAVTDTKKGYIITEYCGHMFPTKPFDNEAHRTQHALRHARVLSDAGCRREIAEASAGACLIIILIKTLEAGTGLLSRRPRYVPQSKAGSSGVCVSAEPFSCTGGIQLHGSWRASGWHFGSRDGVYERGLCKAV